MEKPIELEEVNGVYVVKEDSYIDDCETEVSSQKFSKLKEPLKKQRISKTSNSSKSISTPQQKAFKQFVDGFRLIDELMRGQ